MQFRDRQNEIPAANAGAGAPAEDNGELDALRAQGSAFLAAGNAIIDAAQWLTTTLAGVAPYTGTLGANHTLQRWPPSNDSDNCAIDFRDQGIPSPGTVP